MYVIRHQLRELVRKEIINGEWVGEMKENRKLEFNFWKSYGLLKRLDIAIFSFFIL